jgi:hypothetical protein
MQSQIKTLESDICQLDEQLAAEQEAESKAAEQEDYEEAERLELKIKSIRSLISSKQG